jgi:hypothetical protein
MRKVGAQHLICVSRKEFPKSITEEAKKYGPTVRLVLLEDIEKGNWPIFVVDHSIRVLQRVTGDVTSVHLEIKAGQPFLYGPVKNNINDRVFRLDNSPNTLSLNDLISLYLDKHENQLKHNVAQIIKMHFPDSGQHLSLIQKAIKLDITSLDFEVEVEIKEKTFPMKCLGYRQTNIGTLAWIMDATLQINGVEHDIQITLVPSGNGDFTLKLWNLPNSMKPDFKFLKTNNAN